MSRREILTHEDIHGKPCQLCHERNGERNSQSLQYTELWVCHVCEEEALMDEADPSFEEGYH
jgi:hypothetical protein